MPVNTPEIAVVSVPALEPFKLSEPPLPARLAPAMVNGAAAVNEVSPLAAATFELRTMLLTLGSISTVPNELKPSRNDPAPASAPVVTVIRGIAHAELAMLNDSNARGQTMALHCPPRLRVPEPPQLFDFAASETTCNAPRLVFHTNR